MWNLSLELRIALKLPQGLCNVVLTDFIFLHSTSQCKSLGSIWGSIANENFQTSLRTRWENHMLVAFVVLLATAVTTVCLLIWFYSTWKGSMLNSYNFNLDFSQNQTRDSLFVMPCSTTQNFQVYLEPLLQQECNLTTIMAAVSGLSSDQGTLMLCKVLLPNTWTL